MRHPEDLIKLLLLSPVGLPEKPDDFSHEEVAQRFSSWKGRVGARVFFKLWENNYTPFGLMRTAGSIGASKMLDFYLGRRMRTITSEEEVAAMKAYMH